MSQPSKTDPDPKQKMIDRLFLLYDEAVRKGDCKTALSCLDKIARMQGLYDDES